MKIFYKFIHFDLLFIGMIFIPSRGGISHSPEEYSTFEQMANGTNVLLNTILTLDKLDKITD